VWNTAVTSPDRKQGGISSNTKANAGDAARKLRIEAVHILGLPTAAAPAKAPAAAKAPGAAAVAAPAKGVAKAPARPAAAKAAHAAKAAPARAVRAAARKEVAAAAAAAAAPVAATASVNGQSVTAAYDGKVGVLRITGIKDVFVGAPFSMRWKI
jgi:hypothetical protein